MLKIAVAQCLIFLLVISALHRRLIHDTTDAGDGEGDFRNCTGRHIAEWPRIDGFNLDFAGGGNYRIGG